MSGYSDECFLIFSLFQVWNLSDGEWNARQQLVLQWAPSVMYSLGPSTGPSFSDLHNFSDVGEMVIREFQRTVIRAPN